MDTQRLPMVQEFYRDKEILITGGTGYLGKVLIEKLLRSCGDLKRIFILIRPKKGNSPQQRLNAFTQDQVFDLVRKECPQQLQKIDCISGDVRELGLGISVADFERIRGCQIVIHSAATVRFDELLTDSILMNTRGTRETLMLAKRMDRVEIFNHVSTTFCNPDYPDSEERLYPVDMYWREAINMAERLHPEELETVSKMLLGKHPNTYTFSKRLSEHMVNELRRECAFPVVILRPSVVTPTAEEPFPGWLDNFNGPVGLMVAMSSGIARFAKTGPSNGLDYQPVDIVAKTIILSTWKEANVTRNLEEDVPIYNSSSYGKYFQTNAEMYAVCNKMRFKRPLLKTVWYPDCTFTSCHFYYVLLNVIFLIIPTTIFDNLLKLVKIKSPIQLSRVIRKVYYVQESLEHFLRTNYTFKNHRCMALEKDLQPEELDLFRLDVPLSKHDYSVSCLINARRYLMKEDDSSLPAAIRNMYIFGFLHYSLVALIWGTVLYLGYLYLSSTRLFMDIMQIKRRSPIPLTEAAEWVEEIVAKKPEPE